MSRVGGGLTLKKQKVDFNNENIYFENYYNEQRKFTIHIAYNVLILFITNS